MHNSLKKGLNAFTKFRKVYAGSPSASMAPKTISFNIAKLLAAPLCLHICVLSECVVLSDWWRLRLEVKVQGHYLQPEKAASASSFSPQLTSCLWPALEEGRGSRFKDAQGALCCQRTCACTGDEMRSLSVRALVCGTSRTVPARVRILTYRRETVQVKIKAGVDSRGLGGGSVAYELFKLEVVVVVWLPAPLHAFRQVQSLTPAMCLISMGTNSNVQLDSFLMLTSSDVALGCFYLTWTGLIPSYEHTATQLLKQRSVARVHQRFVRICFILSLIWASVLIHIFCSVRS